MSPQAGEIAVSDSSLLRLGMSCATTADERQSKMKWILPDVNTANCQSPRGNQSSRRMRKGKGRKMLSLEEKWENRTKLEYCHPTEGLGGSLVPEIRKDWLKSQEK